MKLSQNIEKADLLLEKYYEGTSTKAEELWLQDFLQQNHLPERFEADCAFFGYVRTERIQKVTAPVSPIQIEENWNNKTVEPLRKPPRGLRFPLNPYLKAGLVAASLLAAVFIPGYLIQAKNQNVAYVNGVKLTDEKDLRNLALNSILNLKNDDVETSVNALNEDDILESQLAHFPAIE
jgi:hypothetical protein